MTTALSAARILLSKELADYWASASTSAGAAGGTTIVDTGLKAKANDWVPDEMYTLITESGHATINEERKVSSLDNSTGTLTVLAHSAQIGSGVDYELHRLFTSSDKRLALIHAAKHGYPHIFKHIRDESKVSGNWLKDGSLEIWTSSSALTHWTTTTVTIAKTTTSPYYKHGTKSCKMLTAAGRITQSITNWDDLKYLAGTKVTFTAQGHCDTATCLRIAVYDGTTTTYSSYHGGNSAWTEYDDPLEVEATIADKPTVIEFRILHDEIGRAHV